MKSSEKLQMGKFKRLIIAFFFILEGAAYFSGSLFDQRGRYVGLANFEALFHMKDCSLILSAILACVFVTILVAVFLFLGHKKPFFFSLLIYCICNILKNILLVPIYEKTEEGISMRMHENVGDLFVHYYLGGDLVYIMLKALPYFVLLFFLFSFMKSKHQFSNSIKNFWWIPGIFRCCAIFWVIFPLLYARVVRGTIPYVLRYGNMQIPFFMFDAACCQVIECFFLGWWLTHCSRQHLESEK